MTVSAQLLPEPAGISGERTFRYFEGWAIRVIQDTLEMKTICNRFHKFAKAGLQRPFRAVAPPARFLVRF